MSAFHKKKKEAELIDQNVIRLHYFSNFNSILFGWYEMSQVKCDIKVELANLW